MLRIEKELEEARGRLTAIRQAKYKLRAGDTSGDDTDTDVHFAGYSSDASTHHRLLDLFLALENNLTLAIILLVGIEQEIFFKEPPYSLNTIFLTFMTRHTKSDINCINLIMKVFSLLI